MAIGADLGGQYSEDEFFSIKNILGDFPPRKRQPAEVGYTDRSLVAGCPGNGPPIFDDLRAENNKPFCDVVDQVAELVKKKNTAYGNSFGTAGDALKILYPKGIQPDQYCDMLLITRIWDKLKRLATANDPLGESPYMDIAGYAICGLTTKEGK